MNERIAVIGAGNMAGALIGGLCSAGHPPSMIVATDPDPGRREAANRAFGVEVLADNRTAVSAAEVVILAVKPQVFDEVLQEIAAALRADALVISVAAGVPVRRIAGALGDGRAIVRAMPNTPALIGAGATGVHYSPDCTEAHRAFVERLFGTVGICVEITDESLMDVVTAVSGSGPAYFFALTEALAEAGHQAGLAVDVARRLAVQTAIGAGRMLAESGKSAEQLRRQVTSPGGTTEAALDCLGRKGFGELVQAAVDAAIARGRQLGEH
ncbi:MAG: pyrroline-5-carboxylate reductase [Wenzhouxiangellaceae bacterium]